jgi:hypothetical protein
MRCLVLSICAALLTPGSLLGRTWYVKPDCTGDASTIQAGVDFASSGDTILLADGVYAGDGSRDIEYGGRSFVVQPADSSLLRSLTPRCSE